MIKFTNSCNKIRQAIKQSKNSNANRVVKRIVKRGVSSERQKRSC